MFRNLNDILAAAGPSLDHVVKYTLFTTDIDRFVRETHDVRSPYFSAKPGATLVEVSRLIDRTCWSSHRARAGGARVTAEAIDAEAFLQREGEALLFACTRCAFFSMSHRLG